MVPICIANLERETRDIDGITKKVSDCAYGVKNMNVHYSDNRKIDPSQGPCLGDGTENDGNRVEIGPTALAHARRG